jgi:hypothetical protein
LGGLLVILLPRAPEQQLIRRVLDEGMLEPIGGSLGGHAALVQQFGIDELCELALQGLLLQEGNRAEQLVSKLAPDRGTQLGDTFGRA